MSTTFCLLDKRRPLQDGTFPVKIAAGCGTDAPGSYIAWLCGVTEVHAMEMPGKRYDIGNLESYEKVKAEYKGITYLN